MWEITDLLIFFNHRLLSSLKGYEGKRKGLGKNN